MKAGKRDKYAVIAHRQEGGEWWGGNGVEKQEGIAGAERGWRGEERRRGLLEERVRSLSECALKTWTMQHTNHYQQREGDREQDTKKRERECEREGGKDRNKDGKQRVGVCHIPDLV